MKTGFSVARTICKTTKVAKINKEMDRNCPEVLGIRENRWTCSNKYSSEKQIRSSSTSEKNGQT